MPKSIRVSDQLYEIAESSSQAMHRSLAQQLEHWATLGRAVEAAGVTTAQIEQVLAGDLRARERLMLKLGLADQESMYLIPTHVAQRSKVSFPEVRGRAAKAAGGR
jgi:hypothetical protein